MLYLSEVCKSDQGEVLYLSSSNEVNIKAFWPYPNGCKTWHATLSWLWVSLETNYNQSGNSNMSKSVHHYLLYSYLHSFLLRMETSNQWGNGIHKSFSEKNSTQLKTQMNQKTWKECIPSWENSLFTKEYFFYAVFFHWTHMYVCDGFVQLTASLALPAGE